MKLTDKQCAAILDTACGPSGIKYWVSGRATWGMRNGNDTLALTDLDGKRHVITHAVIRRGFSRLVQGWIDGSLSLPYGCDRGGVEGWDGPACDVVVQLGLFNSIVYG